MYVLYKKDRFMMNFMRLLFSLILVVVSTAHADEIVISSSEARQWANTKGHELILALSEPNLATKYAKLDSMMEKEVNLDYVSKFVIGKYAKKMTPMQKKTYTDLFHRYAKSLYKKTKMTFDANAIDFKVTSVTEHEKFASVVCVVKPPKLSEGIEIQDIPVQFKLIRGQDNRIQAVDVAISDVSMVIEYRKRFYQMIKDERENIDWFLERFEAQVTANEESAITNLIGNGTI